MSGYIYCHCRDCFDITVGDPGEFCAECIDAGCPDYQEVEGMSQECQRDDAYERSTAECMPAHTRVKMHSDGSATVNTGVNTARWYRPEIKRALGMSERCCESRGVKFPEGQEHCPCLACNVAKAARYFKEAPRDQERS